MCASVSIPSFDSRKRFWIRILSGRNWGIPPDKNTSIGFRIGVVFYSEFSGFVFWVLLI